MSGSAYFDEKRFLEMGFTLDMVQVLRQAFEGDFRKLRYIQLNEYDDLADIQADIADSDATTNMLVKVDGQGLATWNGSAWVLASNDTTAIT